jgi:RimJ/RimL family protein N-acetyltransferase
MIETERLVLRPVRLEDDAAMVRLLADDEAGVRMTERLPWPMTQEAARGWLALRLGPREHALTISPKAVGGMVGVIGFRLEGEAAGFGYWLGAGFRGRGLATEALLVGLGHARALGARRAVAETFLDNLASQRVLTKAGFAAAGEVERAVSTRVGTQRLRRFAAALSPASDVERVSHKQSF